MRTAWLINGPQALERLAGYSGDRRSAVQDELVAAWSYFDPDEYAHRVLADAPLRSGKLKIEDPRLLPAVGPLRNLRELEVSLPENTALSCLEGIPALTRLTAEKISAADLPFLAEHQKLREVHLYQIDGDINDMTPFFDLPKISGLYLNNGRLAVDMSFLRKLPQLTGLALPELPDTADFTHLSSQEGLSYLSLYGCKNLRSIDSLSHLTRLKNLTLRASSLPQGSTEEIARTWPGLRSLQVIDADWMTSLAPITTLPLTGLTVNKCNRISDIAPIAYLDQLHWLYLYETPFTDLDPIKDLTRLKTLSLGGGGRVLDLTPLAGLARLKQFYLNNVDADTDLSPLRKIHNLAISLPEGQRIRGMDQLPRSTRFEWAPP